MFIKNITIFVLVLASTYALGQTGSKLGQSKNIPIKEMIQNSELIFVGKILKIEESKLHAYFGGIEH